MVAPNVDKLERLAMELAPEERRELVRRLASSVGQDALPARRPPRSIGGMLRGKVPEDFDIEAAVREIRDEWKAELDAMGGDGEIP